MTIIFLALLAWGLITRSGDLPRLADRLARVAGMAYALGVVCGQYVHLANDWLAERVTGRRPWFTTPAPAPLAAAVVFGSEFILLDEPALMVECLTYQPPAKPAKRRRTRAVKVATGG
jgi:hypothetical protein